MYPKQDDHFRFLARVAAGEIGGYRRIALYGNNPDVDGGTLPEDAWSGGGPYPWMTASTTLEILSSNLNDNQFGTGARTVTITGLIATTYQEVTFTVALNGTAPVTIAQPLFRINAATVSSVGINGTNQGTITIRDAGGGTTRAIMPIGYGLLRQAVYTVPAGYDFVISSVSGSINRDTGTATRQATASSWVRLANGVILLPGEQPVTTEPFRDIYSAPAVLPEKTDTALRIVATSHDNLDITLGLMGYLKQRTAS